MLSKQEAVLVIVDVQGKLAELMWQSEKLLNQLGRLIDGFKILNIPILWLEQCPDKLGPTAAPIAEKLAGQTPFCKTSFSGWGEDSFRDALQRLDRKQIIIAGIETHICVYQTTRDLLINNFEVTVIADTVSSRAEENRATGLEMMRQHGAQLSCVEAILFELQQVAEGDTFRQIARLVK